jgi:hypothetical protein
MASGGIILPLVIIFLIYFIFFDKWNRRKYKDLVEFTSWLMPVLFLQDNTQESVLRTYAIDNNGYYLYTGPSGESPADSLGNLRSYNDKQIIKRNSNTIIISPLDKYDLIDSNGDILTGKVYRETPKTTGVTGELIYSGVLKNKEGKVIVNYSIKVKDNTIPEYFDYTKNILKNGCTYKWELSGYIFKSDWRDIKDWIFKDK